jgi:hypothetical protein
LFVGPLGHRINAHRSADLQKNARIESGVRQKTCGSCDLIKKGETGDAKCLTPSTLALPVAGLFLVRRGGLGKRAVTELERKHLVETDRHIAECKNYIAKQRELIERAIQRGRSTEVAETTLEALETSLREFERQRRCSLIGSKSASETPIRTIAGGLAMIGLAQALRLLLEINRRP